MKNASNKNIMKQINYYFSAVVGNCCCLCGLFLCSLLLLVDVKIDIEAIVEFIEFINAKFIQSLINQMHEQSFYLLHSSVFFLQPIFQMLYEKATSEDSPKNNLLYLNNSFVLHFTNTMLIYLRKMQKGARTNGVLSGSRISSD